MQSVNWGQSRSTSSWSQHQDGLQSQSLKCESFLFFWQILYLGIKARTTDQQTISSQAKKKSGNASVLRLPRPRLLRKAGQKSCSEMSPQPHQPPPPPSPTLTSHSALCLKLHKSKPLHAVMIKPKGSSEFLTWNDKNNPNSCSKTTGASG